MNRQHSRHVPHRKHPHKLAYHPHNFMKTCLISLLLSGSLLSIMSCSSTRHNDKGDASRSTVISTATTIVAKHDNTPSVLPNAVIYKTNRDVSNHVSVVLTPDHMSIASFPAPSDVGTFSTPLHLAEGWLLDRRGGIGSNTAFLTYTYSEYSALTQTPSPNDLMTAIIPGITVTEAYRLNLTLSHALNDTATVNRIITEGLPGATPIVKSVRLQSPQ